MDHCSHKNLRKEKVKREFLGKKFSGETLVCSDCGAEMWDDKLELSFKTWIASLDVRRKIQFKVSDHADACLVRLMDSFPNVGRATFIRAMVLLFMVLLERKPEANKFLNDAFDSKYFTGFEARPSTHMFASEVKPAFFYDLMTWANIYGVKPNEMASNAFHVMLSIFITEDVELRNFWNEEIYPELQNLLLKAS